MSVDKAQLLNLVSRIESAIERISPNLSGQRVLTEAASGPFAATPVIAAVAGADHVVAVTRSSQWGTVEGILGFTQALAKHFGVDEVVEISTRSSAELAYGADVVTNLGFVRPISRLVVENLSAHAAIALMWEPWEFRDEDIDLAACHKRNIPVVATNEHHPHVATFRFVGLLALKMLFEAQCEVNGLNVLVIGSDPFGSACQDVLSSVGARVTVLDPLQKWPPQRGREQFELCDAIVVVEHRYKGLLLSQETATLIECVSVRQIPLVHICGAIDSGALASYRVHKYPAVSVPVGYMTLTTAHVGTKPVVDLHCAGLHAASLVARARREGKGVEESIQVAIASGYGLSLDCRQTALTPKTSHLTKSFAT